jgi:hypothetical protein
MDELNKKKEKFLDTLTWHFGVKTNLRGSINLVRKELERLNDNLRNADESSTRLTQALNRLTLFGVIIAGGSLLVAFVTLIFEIIRELNG